MSNFRIFFLDKHGGLTFKGVHIAHMDDDWKDFSLRGRIGRESSQSFIF